MAELMIIKNKDSDINSENIVPLSELMRKPIKKIKRKNIKKPKIKKNVRKKLKIKDFIGVNKNKIRKFSSLVRDFKEDLSDDLEKKDRIS